MLQERLEVPFDVYKRNEEVLTQHEHGSVHDNQRRWAPFQFRKEGEKIYIIGGEFIAETFELDAPTITKFNHVGPYSMFEITFLPVTDSLQNTARIEKHVVCNNNVTNDFTRDAEVQMHPKVEILAEKYTNKLRIKVNRL